MECPHCRVPLAIAERQGIEVDYCPQCRGVWLDRGELDKIIERSSRQFDAPPAPPRQDTAWVKPREKDREDERYKGDHHRNEPGYYDHRQHKKKSFLQDIFDF